MTSLSTMLLCCAALGGQDEYLILDFTAPWCGPCQRLEPTIQRLQQAGAPIRQVNLDDHPDLARQFQVSAIPCCILVRRNQVLDRAVGGDVNEQRLRAMWARGEQASRGAAREVSAGTASASPAPIPISAPAPGASLPESSAAPGNRLEQLALQATVRIQVRDGGSTSYGTGTVIGVHGPDALVITCGHLFRDSQGRGEITVDLFAQGTRRSVPGKLLDYEAEERDIAVLTMRPGVRIRPMQVAGPEAAVALQSPVFSVGCDQGADPSVRRSRITAINRYQGAPNIEAAGAPVYGRSGGGLFTQEGRLIGVCNAADREDDEGIYAALPSIHWQLARIGQEQLYSAAPPPEPPIPAATAGVAAAEPAPASLLEVVCTVREDGQERTFVVRNPSPDLLARLRQESQGDLLIRGQR